MISSLSRLGCWTSLHETEEQNAIQKLMASVW